MADDNVKEMEETLEKLKVAYKEFEAAHDKYHEGVKEEDEDESERYFRDVQRNYIEAVKPARAWLLDKRSQLDQKDIKEAKSESVPNNATAQQLPNDEEAKYMLGKHGESFYDLITVMSQPKVELKNFDGNPLEYHCFIVLFEESVKSIKDDSLKLTRLLQYTSDKAYNSILSCVLLADGYKRAREILHERYGNDHQVAEMIVNKIRRGRPVRSAEELQDLADELQNSQRTLSQIRCLHEVDNQNCISEISKRLDYRVQEKWITRVMEVKRSTKAYPDFKEFADFVVQQAQRANDPVYGHSRSKRNDTNNNKSSSSFTTEVVSSGNVVRFPCVLCNADHKLFGCDMFRSMRPVQRLEVVNKYKLCENCLMSNHTTQMCRRPTRCTVPDCNQKHTKFIHINNRSSDSAVEVNSGNDSIVNDGVRLINANVSTNSDVHMPVIAVSVNHSREVCALLDSGSSNSFITKALVNSLNLSGNVVSYSLNTLSGEQNVKSHAVNVSLSSLDGAESLELHNVYVIDNIPVYTSTPKIQEYSHFKGLQLVDGGQEVQILIGQDNAEALIPLEVRRGNKGDPFATRTLFGWSVNGPDAMSKSINNKVLSNFICATSIEEKVKQLWEIEEGSYSTEQGMSQEDRKVLEVWSKELKCVDGHFELPIPKREGALFPNNYVAAESRLTSLVKSLKRKGLMSRYNDEIVKLLNKGYAEPVEETECEEIDSVWYLPHHPVITDKKPGKLRVVFDCAAKYKGESLNDKCLQGPDLNNKLLHVLLRFRQHRYAFTADIESMYYQVRIPIEQRDILRFLWVKGGSETIQKFRMTGHVFGGVWCASSTSYALRQALVNREVDDAVSDTILRSFYVDDCLRSVERREDVAHIIDGTRNTLKDSGFNLTKFMVNDHDILQSIPLEHRATEAKDFNPSTCSKVLGIRWSIAADEFYFDADVVSESQVTKRSILSIVASMYDPFGFINPLILSGKLMFQEATALKGTWDEEVPIGLASRWLSWLDSLKCLSELRIPRCIKPCEYNNAAMELHVFSDSSERAYGSCCYLRLINKNGLIHTSLLLAKSRVAPHKFTSIPRLELQAAVLSVQLESILKKELDLQLTDSYFWTDSEIVLKYISNDSRRFQVFVANRVSSIRQSTDPSQWHHIAGLSNPADMLTRPQHLTTMDMQLWLEGPKFLRSHKSNWLPSEVDPSLAPDDPEVKKVSRESVITFVSSIHEEHPMDKLVGYYSDWNRLIRAVAWLIRGRKILLKSNSIVFSKELSLSEVRYAEIEIIKNAQMKYYSKEFDTLAAEGKVDRNSHIRELSPSLDHNGIIRVNGRIKNASVDIGMRQPILIPNMHPIAKMIARQYHNEAHLGTEWVVSKIRELYWITKIRGVVKSVSYECITCKKLFAASSTQQMANLPLERVQHGNPPFSNVGMDCFGPFYVKRGRCQIKRYGCLFTCMAMRAVHIEKLDSLDTDSFLNGLRRFVSRRGYPEKIFCDNGTNFVGGKGELSRSLKELDQELIQKYCVIKEIEWVFNPPAASHMGGTWERIIRTIRKVIAGLIPSSCSMSDEGLHTLFCEVEAIINGRPLTKCSSDVGDLAPLTPNHLLLMRDLPALPPGVFTEADAFRRRWRCVQHYANVFWQRWLKEYLPELQKRSKWLEKERNLREGDLVLIVEENTPRGVWPLGLITEAHQSEDGLVRSVKIRTKSTCLVRPITKVVLLEGSAY